MVRTDVVVLAEPVVDDRLGLARCCEPFKRRPASNGRKRCCNPTCFCAHRWAIVPALAAWPSARTQTTPTATRPLAPRPPLN